MVAPTQEEIRLAADRRQQSHWRRWEPDLSDRQWGTVREDYSPYGSAWDYFTHEQARSRAYRWGEDGLLGISDDRQQLIMFRDRAVEWGRSHPERTIIWFNRSN